MLDNDNPILTFCITVSTGYPKKLLSTKKQLINWKLAQSWLGGPWEMGGGGGSTVDTLEAGGVTAATCLMTSPSSPITQRSLHKLSGKWI